MARLVAGISKSIRKTDLEDTFKSVFLMNVYNSIIISPSSSSSPSLAAV